MGSGQLIGWRVEELSLQLVLLSLLLPFGILPIEVP
jgi:hypothetical protein